MNTKSEALRCAVSVGIAAELRQHAAIVALTEALQPFALLLQEHNDNGPDSKPVFGINDALVTVGHLRAARAVLAEHGASE